MALVNNSSPRLIDTTIPPGNPTTPRRANVKALVFAAPRTGSTSLGLAMGELAYNTYSVMTWGVQTGRDHYPYWTEAIQAKYRFGESNGKKPYDETDWDKLIPPETEVLRGLHAILFVEEFLAMYPEAKVIYSKRDPEGLLKSIKENVVHVLGAWDWRFIQMFERGVYTGLWSSSKACADAWALGAKEDDKMTDGKRIYPWNSEKLKKSYLQHNALVERLVPAERLLFFKPRDGWAPLCEFLGKEVPMGVEYPKSMGSGAPFFEAMGHYWWEGFKIALRNAALGSLGVAAVAMATWKMAAHLRRIR